MMVRCLAIQVAGGSGCTQSAWIGRRISCSPFVSPWWSSAFFVLSLIPLSLLSVSKQSILLFLSKCNDLFLMVEPDSARVVVLGSYVRAWLLTCWIWVHGWCFIIRPAPFVSRMLTCCLTVCGWA